jgi:hypothetical protein
MLVATRESVTQRNQRGAQVLALLVVEAGEQCVFSLSLSARGVIEVPPPGRGERDDVAAAVYRVALARDEAVDFERVEQRNEDAGIYAHGLPELALAHRPVIVQKPEQLELSRLKVVGGMRLAQAAHCLLPEQREQKARAGSALFENATGSLGCGRFAGHGRKKYITLNR